MFIVENLEAVEEYIEKIKISCYHLTNCGKNFLLSFFLCLRINDKKTPGGQSGNMNNRRGPCVKDICWKRCQGKVAGRNGNWVSVLRGVCGELKVTSPTQRMQQLLRSSRSPPRRDEGPCSQTACLLRQIRNPDRAGVKSPDLKNLANPKYSLVKDITSEG